MIAEDVCHACHAIGLMRRETTEHIGQYFSGLFLHAAWNDGFPGRVVSGLNQAEHSTAGEFAIVLDGRVFCSCSIGSVQPPVARDDIHMAVSIQISRSDAIPPAGERVES